MPTPLPRFTSALASVAAIATLFAAPAAAHSHGGTAAARRPVPIQQPSDAELRAVLRARRRHHLSMLRDYRRAGLFPQNQTQPGEGHFLIDPFGTLCAVANLIALDGGRHLIVDASSWNNGLLFGEVEDGPFLDWILTSGFTQEEIARIQVPAPYVGPEIIVPGVEPSPVPRPEVLAANRAVRDYLARIERQLARNERRALDRAVARLRARGDLTARLYGNPFPVEDGGAPPEPMNPPPVAQVGFHFASPPPAR